MRTTRRVAAGVGLVLTMAACASKPTAPSVSPSQLLAAGVQSLMALQSTQVEGSFTVDGLDGSVQASMLRNGNASGTSPSTARIRRSSPQTGTRTLDRWRLS
jgi:hypothetical protein